MESQPKKDQIHLQELLMDMGRQFAHYQPLAEKKLIFPLRTGVVYFVSIFENTDYPLMIRAKALTALEEFAPVSDYAFRVIVQWWIKSYGEMGTYVSQAIFRLIDGNEDMEEKILKMWEEWGL